MKPSTADFEAPITKTSWACRRGDSPPVLKRSNPRCWRVSNLPPSTMTPYSSFALLPHGQPTRTFHHLPYWLAYSNFPSPSFLTLLTPYSPYHVLLLCTMWTTHDSTLTPRVPQSKPNHIHPTWFPRRSPHAVDCHVVSYTSTLQAKRHNHTTFVFTPTPQHNACCNISWINDMLP